MQQQYLLGDSYINQLATCNQQTMSHLPSMQMPYKNKKQISHKFGHLKPLTVDASLYDNTYALHWCKYSYLPVSVNLPKERED